MIQLYAQLMSARCLLLNTNCYVRCHKLTNHCGRLGFTL
uniref:Uncharacterized protein n=1 Tax=Arundo donax TaxID=35708 RepID=A0A0A9BSC8_ARUDO